MNFEAFALALNAGGAYLPLSMDTAIFSMMNELVVSLEPALRVLGRYISPRSISITMGLKPQRNSSSRSLATDPHDEPPMNFVS